jgi:pimeloyl-ACP methyl ester carboxylesterase
LNGHLFLFHWNTPEAEAHAARLSQEGWLVDFETSDGARGGRFVKSNPPDGVLISLDRLPSHGRAVAEGLFSYKATRSLPLIFLGGSQAAVEKTRQIAPAANYLGWDALPQRLSEILATRPLVQVECGIAPVYGGQLYYEVAGAGHPLLLIHAGIADASMWDAQFEAFARHFRTIRYDARGYGRSHTESVPYSDRQDITDLLDHLGVQKTFILGLSRGGQLAIDYTLDSPWRVAALVAVASGVSGYEHQPDNSPKSQAERLAFTQMDELDERGDYVALNDLEVGVWVDGPNQPEGRALPSVRSLIRRLNGVTFNRQDGKPTPQPLDPPALGRLETINVPTLVIVGDLDTTAVLRISAILTQHIRGARQYIYQGVAHMVNLEAPQRFNQDVLAFLHPLATYA